MPIRHSAKHNVVCSVWIIHFDKYHGRHRLATVVKLLFLSEKHAQNLLMAEFDDW